MEQAPDDEEFNGVVDCPGCDCRVHFGMKLHGPVEEYLVDPEFQAYIFEINK